MAFGSGAVVKVGTIQAFGGAIAPDGWLFCDGAETSRTTYADLFAVIGTTYGAGDGSTTFNLPNLRILGQTSPVSVYGNGKTITYTDYTQEFGLASATNDPGRVWASSSLKYTNVGTVANGGTVKTDRGIGLSLNTQYGATGIVGTAYLYNASQTVRAIIKY